MSETTVPPQDAARVFRKLKANSANKVCFDCGTKNPSWTSITFGIYLCLHCSGTHRKMGSHISFVKSSVLDKWQHRQLEAMVAGGNDRAAAFFRQHGWTKKGSAKEKYTSRAAKLYCQRLAREAQQAGAALAALLQSPRAPAQSPPPDAMQGLKDLENEVLEQMRRSPSLNRTSPTAMGMANQPMGANASVSMTEYEAAPPKAVPARVVKRTPLIRVKPKRSNLTSLLSTRKKKPTHSNHHGPTLLSVAPQRAVQADELEGLMSNLAINTVDKHEEPQAEETPEVAAPAPVKPTPAPSSIFSKPKPVSVEPKVGARPQIFDRPRKKVSEAPQSRRFHEATSISSEQYFHAENLTSAEDRRRLDQFSTSSAISSDAFFGREEEEDHHEVDLVAHATHIADAARSFFQSFTRADQPDTEQY